MQPEGIALEAVVSVASAAAAAGALVKTAAPDDGVSAAVASGVDSIFGETASAPAAFDGPSAISTSSGAVVQPEGIAPEAVVSVASAAAAAGALGDGEPLLLSVDSNCFVLPHVCRVLSSSSGSW